MMEGMTIGRLAKRAGVSIDTVRFYERRRLLSKPARTESNYRVYAEDEVARLRFIKKAKDLGFSLSEIRELLSLRCDPSALRADVKNQIEVKIDDIKQKIDDLSRILTALEHLSATCDGRGPVSDCPILRALDDNDGECADMQ
jgi:Zn(II)-responsive transcriptional regulator